MKTRRSGKARSRLTAALLFVLTLVTVLGSPAAAASAPAPLSAAFAVIQQNLKVAQLVAKVTIFCDGTVRTLDYVSGTVGDLLTAQGITVGNNDRVLPTETVALTPGMTISVTRADIKLITVNEVVPRTTVYIANEYLPKGTEKVISEGSDGSRRVDYELTLCGGIEMSRRAVAVEVFASSADRVIEYGPGGTIVTDDGTVLNWSHKIDGQATAYTTEGYRNKINALGKVARTGTIAVDPKVIPLRSSVYVEGAGWEYGESVAEDTGGVVKGNIIDLYFDTRAECFQFGRRSCTIYILE